MQIKKKCLYICQLIFLLFLVICSEAGASAYIHLESYFEWPPFDLSSPTEVTWDEANGTYNAYTRIAVDNNAPFEASYSGAGGVVSQPPNVVTNDASVSYGYGYLGNPSFQRITNNIWASANGVSASEVDVETNYSRTIGASVSDGQFTLRFRYGYRIGYSGTDPADGGNISTNVNVSFLDTVTNGILGTFTDEINNYREGESESYLSGYYEYERLFNINEGMNNIHNIQANVEFINFIELYTPKLPETNPIPEPATMLLIGLGLAGLAGVGRKFKK